MKIIRLLLIGAFALGIVALDTAYPIMSEARFFDDANTPLHRAIQSAKTTEFRAILADIENMTPDLAWGALTASNGYGQTPLHLAVKCSNMDILYKLLAELVRIACLACLSQAQRIRISELWYSRINSLETFLAFIDELPEHSDIFSQIFWALDRRDNFGETALHDVARLDGVRVAAVLFTIIAYISPEEKAALLNAKNRNEQTALGRAMERGNIATMKMLIEKGADVNFQDMYGETPLHLAARWDSIELTEMLLRAGARRNIRDHDYRKPAAVARRHGNYDIANMIETYTPAPKYNYTQEPVSGKLPPINRFAPFWSDPPLGDVFDILEGSSDS